MHATKSIFLVILSLSIYINVKGQEKDISVLDFSFNYSTNSNTFGQFNQQVNQPMYTLNTGWYSKYNVDFSIGGIISDNSDDSLQAATSELDLTLGYNLTLWKRLLIYPSVSHFFYSENSNTLKSSLSDNLQLDISADLKWYNPGVSLNYLIGDDENTFYLFLRNSFIYEKYEVFSKYDAFFIQPDISFIFGNQRYFTANNLDSYSSRDILRLLQSQPSLRTEFLAIRDENPDLTAKEILKIMYTTEEFNLNNIALTLPVYYMYKSFTFSISMLTFFPINTPAVYDDSPQTYFDFGISYSILF